MSSEEYLDLRVPAGTMRVTAKLDDEGVVLDALDENGHVIASTWKTYEEFGKEVRDEEEGQAA